MEFAAPQGNEAKDYLDIYALMTAGHFNLAQGIAEMSIDISLEEVAKHVNWYTDPDRLLANPKLFLCQMMARGTIDDVVAAQRHYSSEEFRKAYLCAPPGLFSRRAWAYWGLMLLDDPKYPPPERLPGSNQLDWRQGA